MCERAHVRGMWKEEGGGGRQRVEGERHPTVYIWSVSLR